ncbi:MAG: class I SAM-dependent methyltransferase [Candidatus Binatia bacterium]
MPFSGPFDQDYFESGVATGPGYTYYPRVASWMDEVAADIEAEIGPLAGLDVLEVGCAYGILADLLSALGANVTGLDISTWAISQAQSRYPSLTFVEGDVLSLPFPRNSFDVVIGIGVLECLADNAAMEVALREAKRVLKPQGALYGLASTIGPPEWYLQRTPAEMLILVESIGWGGNRTVTVTNVRGQSLGYDVRLVVE